MQKKTNAVHWNNVKNKNSGKKVQTHIFTGAFL